MTKHTHKGTCQLCGAQQAVRADGRIAKHGYTTRFHFFEGTCHGSDERPLQVERKVADQYIKAWRQRVIDEGNLAMAIAEGKRDDLVFFTQIPDAYKPERCEKSELDERQINRCRAHTGHKYVRSAGLYKQAADELVGRVSDIWQTPLIPVKRDTEARKEFAEGAYFDKDDRTWQCVKRGWSRRAVNGGEGWHVVDANTGFETFFSNRSLSRSRKSIRSSI